MVTDEMFEKLMMRLLAAERRIARLEQEARTDTTPAFVLHVNAAGTAWTDGGSIRIGSKAQTYGTDQYGQQVYKAETAEIFRWS
jgi:hypothetical protein